MAQERILVGQIGSAHGLRGEVKLISFTDDPLAIAEYGSVDLEDGMRLTFAGIRRSKSSLIARFEGVCDLDGAERLKGLKLFVPRDRLPPLEKGTYYHADLIGLQASSGAKELGRVVRVVNFGAGDLLEIEPAGSGATLFVPFTGAQVDLEKGIIAVELAEGFLESE
jgi:16S rRNA processing protein RimM